METFIDRLRVEHNELIKKIEKLNDFIEENPKLEDVGEIQEILLINQLNAMQMYGYALSRRIYDLENGGQK